MKLIYENDNIFYGTIILNEHFEKIVRNRYFYFSDSQFGKEYKILFDKPNNFLVHAETEFIDASVKPLLEDLEKQQYQNVLILGLGTGYLNDKIYSLNKNAKFTVIEKYQYISEIKNYISCDIDLQFYDVKKDYNKIADSLGVYDIIIDDIFPDLYYKKALIDHNLSPNGSFYFISDWKKYNTPLNYIKIKKQEYGYQAESIDSRVENFVIDDYNIQLLEW